MSLLMRKRLLLAKREIAYATDAAPGAANAILARNLEVTPVNSNLVPRDLIRPYLGNSEQIPVNTSVECTGEIEMAGAGTPGSAPGWGPLLRACGFAESLLGAAAGGTAQAGAASTITLAASASAVNDAYKGMAIRLTGGAGSGQTRAISAYNGTTKVATVADAWTVPPDATTTYSIDAQAVYTPVSSGFDSATLYYNVDGVLHKILGARGTVNFNATAAQLPVMQFRFLGTYAGVTDTALITPDYSAFQKPKPVNIPSTPQFRLHGASSPMQQVAADMANNLVFRSLPGGIEEVLITDRRAAGTVIFEATPIATKDWFTAAKDVATGPLSLIQGITAGNIVQLESPTAQITNPRYTDQEGIAMLTCGLTLIPTVGNDEIAIIAR